NQAGFQDWILAERINERIRKFDERALQLHHAIMKGLDWKPLDAAAAILLPGLLNAVQTEEAIGRLQSQFRQEYDQLSAVANVGRAGADTWIKSILVLETAADLGQRDEMNIFGITANSAELAGAALQAFMGFFRQEYRDHDYDIGRTKAQQFLMRKSGNLPIRNFTPKPIRQIDPGLAGLELARVPLKLREEMLERLVDR